MKLRWLAIIFALLISSACTVQGTPATGSFAPDVTVRMNASAPIVTAEVTRVREVHQRLQRMDSEVQDAISGHYLKQGLLRVYLKPGADPQAMQQAVQQATAGFMAPVGVRVVTDVFEGRTMPEGWQRELLQDWQDRTDIDMLSMSHFDRVALPPLTWLPTYEVETALDAHKTRKAIERAGVPPGAAAITIGRKTTMDNPPTFAMLPNGVAIRLEIGAASGNREMHAIAVLTNESRQPAKLTVSPNYPMNLFVYTLEGEEVRCYYCGFMTDDGKSISLAPGEEARFELTCDLTDNDGFALPPGNYFVRATVARLVSEPLKLRVTR